MTVQVRSHRAIATRAGVAAAVAGDPGPVLDILEFDLDDVAVFDEETGERRLMVDVPIAAGVAEVNQLDLLQEGVHPVSVQIRRGGLLIAEATTLVDVIRTDGPGRGPLAFTILAALRDSGPLPNESESVAAAVEIERLIELVNAVDEPVTVALPPTYLSTVLDRTVQLGGELTAALDADDRLLVLPDQPLDPSAAVEAGLEDELARGIANGEAQLDQRFSVTPTVRGAWIADGPITAEGATAIRSLGIPLLVVPFDRYLTLGNNLGAFTDPTLMFDAALTDDSAMRMMVVDPIVELLDPDAEGSPIERAVHLMADASALRYQLDPDRRSLILTTPDIGIPDPAVLGELSLLAAQHPAITFQTVGQIPDLTNTLFNGGTPVVVDLDPRPGISLGARAQAAQIVRLHAADTASMLPADDPRPGAWDQDLRTALSTGLTGRESAEIVDAVDTDIDLVRAQVVQPEPFSFTIAGDAAPIPLRVENRGDTPLRVQVHVESDKLDFPSGDFEQLLEANQITNVDIPVEARSNGVFPVVVELRTPNGTALTEPVELTARVSTLTGLGRLVTVGALLVLATWWFSYFRRRRIERRANGIVEAQERHPTVAADPRPAHDADDEQ
ncbi:MAG: DUF6049 family protein [Ilumatobacteraceae bacterium]|nr:DUF6049 family protein [Ilumatobacteraceae bacterium]